MKWNFEMKRRLVAEKGYKINMGKHNCGSVWLLTSNKKEKRE